MLARSTLGRIAARLDSECACQTAPTREGASRSTAVRQPWQSDKFAEPSFQRLRYASCCWVGAPCQAHDCSRSCTGGRADETESSKERPPGRRGQSDGGARRRCLLCVCGAAKAAEERCCEPDYGARSQSKQPTSSGRSIGDRDAICCWAARRQLFRGHSVLQSSDASVCESEDERKRDDSGHKERTETLARDDRCTASMLSSSWQGGRTRNSDPANGFCLHLLLGTRTQLLFIVRVQLKIPGREIRSGRIRISSVNAVKATSPFRPPAKFLRPFLSGRKRGKS